MNSQIVYWYEVDTGPVQRSIRQNQTHL